MNLYRTLGVSQDATKTEIKRAYRRLAMTWHPDRNDHPDATERFKEISAAYEAILLRSGSPAYEAETTDDSFSAPEEVRLSAADIRFNLEVSLFEAWSGCQKTVHYQRASVCPTCEGSGEYGMTRTRFCGACHGSGRVRDKQQGLTSCEVCLGRGFFSERICPDCAGHGRQMASVSLQITVPSGMLSGDDLRLAGQGEPGDETLDAGDLFLTIVIHSHPLFTLQGRDLLLEMPVNALALLAGSKINVPLPVSCLEVVLEAGASSVRQLRLPHKGYPGRGKVKSGDLLLTLHPVFPQHLSSKQRKLLQQAVDSLDSEREDCFPQIATWWRDLSAEGSAES